MNVIHHKIKSNIKKEKILAPPSAKKAVKKVITHFRPMIRSRHPSHAPLRSELPLMKFKSVIRFGSTTELEDVQDKGGNRIELNSTEAIKNSACKLRMKQCFAKANVKTADWWTYRIDKFTDFTNTITSIDKLPYPIVAKHHFGSRGTGNYLLHDQKQLEEWMKGKDLSKYIFERFYNYVREYRLHVTKNGYFYSCRKMLKKDTPEKDRWFRNDSNSAWIVEENEAFDKPVNWKQIEQECVKALKAVGLDFGAVDLRVQGSKDEKGNTRKECDFIVVEINSAPSFGDITLQKYLEEIPKLLMNKFQKNA